MVPDPDSKYGRGLYVGLEIKRPTAKLSEAQVNFRIALQAVGGRYFVIHSLDELEQVFRDFRFIRLKP